MCNFKKMFGVLKENNVSELFNELNRMFVLQVASDGAIPKKVSELEDEYPNIQSKYLELKGCCNDGDDFDTSDSIKFIEKNIYGDMTFRHHTINCDKFNTIIEYFLASGRNCDECDSSDTAGRTLIETSFRKNEESSDVEMVVHATMIIYEDYPHITEDNLGKVIKHELTHVLLEIMEFVMGISCANDPETNEELFSSIEEFRGFTEFLCDYIPVDAETERGGDPIDKFDHIRKTFLTWVAADLYEPYLKAVAEYYKDKEEDDRERTNTVGDK